MNQLTRQYHDEADRYGHEEFQEHMDRVLAAESDAERGAVDDTFLTAEHSPHDIVLVQSRDGGWEDGLGEFYPNGWYWVDLETDELMGPFATEHEAVMDSIQL